MTTWALVATGVLAWIVVTPSGPSPTAVWDADADVLSQLGTLFGLTHDSLAGYIASHNRTTGEDGLNLTIATFTAAAHGERYGSGGFPSGAALNLTSRVLYCDYAGLFWLFSESRAPEFWANPDLARSYSTTAGLYGNLSLLLYNRVGPKGTDPLTQLGTQRVEVLRAQAGMLHAENAGYAHGVDLTCPNA